MKLARIASLIFLMAVPAFAQRAGPFIINSSTSSCAQISIASDRSSTVTIDVSGTFSATLQPSVAMAGQAAHNVQVTPTTSQTPQSTITAAGGFQALQISGWELFQVCVTSYVSGTATIYLSISTGTVGQLGGGGSGGNTITSPNSTLAVGGSAAATTLDLNGSAGKIMAGATPALTATPTIGLSGTTGSLTVVNTNGTTSNAITENTTGLTLGTITSGTWNGSLISSAFGGTGVNNGSATITLGSASLNFATLGTGIVKNTTTTGALTDAASADVYGLFTSCTGSSGLFLKDGGTCAAPGGSGTVTVVAAGSLTSTAFVTGGGLQALQTPSATSTLSAGGNASFAGTLAASGHVTFEGVTSTGATGTGNLAFSATPTFTGTTTIATLAATTINGSALSGTFTGTPTFSGALTLSGSWVGGTPASLTGTNVTGLPTASLLANAVTSAKVDSTVVTDSGNTTTTAAKVAISTTTAGAQQYIDFPETLYIPAANCNNTTAGAGWSIPAGGTVTCRAGTNNLGGYITITDTSSTFAQFTLTIPADWDSTSRPFIRFFFSSASDTTNGHTVIPQVKVSCPTANNGTTSDDATLTAAQSSSTVTFGASAVTNGFYGTSNVQFGSTQMTGCIASGLMIVQVGRATDTATGNINFYGANVTFPRLIVVQAN